MAADAPLPAPGETPVPNLYIVGAPKAGTTSLHAWLTDHPEVFMSPHKEPDFHCHDLTFDWRFEDLAPYLGLFGDAEGYDHVGEASVWYLYSKIAAQEIHRFSGPDTRIIAMLRNPVEMVHSQHSQLVWMGNEQIEDFDEALAAEPDRQAGKRLPEHLNPREGLYYTQIARYSQQLQRYWDTFGQDQVHTIVFDDLKADNRSVWQSLCRFLNIDETIEVDLAARNPNTTVRSSWVRDVQRQLPRPIKAITERLPMGLRLTLREAVNSLNTEVTERQAMSQAARELLCEAYADDVETLSRMLDRDLTHWTRP